jgi:hypothetical protein
MPQSAPPQATPSASAQKRDPNAAAQLSHRYREGSMQALARFATARGMTQKQVISHALVAYGVEIMPIDLEDRTPTRRRGDDGA